MKANKTRRGYVLWPVLIMSAVSIAGACSGSGGSGTIGGDGGAGGGSEPVDSGGNGAVNTGASSSMGGDEATGGVTSAESGASSGGATGAGGAGVDLCVDLDLSCPDDDNPCTEDECNPATGECGIPRTGTACDDGVYCNGEDTCDAGECSEHAGDPCNGQACIEAEATCECTMDEHCAADVPGEWGECIYGSECLETGTRSRAVTTSTCTAGKCVAGATVENEDCTRETDGVACTDDAKRCTGVEKCLAGECQGSGHSCTGATPFCYNAGTQCRECEGATAGCGGGEKCCGGSCIPSGNTCGIIILPAIGGPTVIAPN